jgi:hypothetical protein
MEELELELDNGQLSGAAYMKAFLIEGARVMGAIGVLMTVIWLIGKPVAIQFVDEAIDARDLAPNSEVVILTRRIDRVENQSVTNGENLIQLREQTNNIEELLTEQRADIKTLLRAIPNRSLP